DPLSDEDLRAAAQQLGVGAARQVVVTEPAFDEALDAVFREEFHSHSASALMTRSPDQSARWVLTRSQKVFLLAAVAAIGLGLVAAPIATATLLMGLATAFYLGFAVYKFYLAYSAIAHTLEIEATDEEVEGLDDRFLPVYTILVPLYMETEVLPLLVKAIDRLDYPKPKLDVKLLLEEDDLETIAAARAANMPSHFKLVIVPRGQPKGKPKACNYGLIYALGELVVIFDAEDVPERDQLKKVVVAFRKADPRVACIQAKLNYFNRDQNLLTRWFTTEYSMWFDLFLPGLDASHAPIPLGGTSNHFRTARLRELGAWDPYNVTEDADLGMRLFKAGWKTAVVDSTTYEEANSEVYNWIRQRSRWVKGYIQTYLVHMRHPVKLLRQIGLKDFLSFQMVIGGTFFGFLANPVFWLLTAGWFIFHWAWIKSIFPPALFYMGAFNLYVGNFAFTYLNVAGCLRRKYYDMVKYALMTPIYWALMSIAAWKGFLQLFYAPSYWEKTKHGLYTGEILTESDALPAAA
ncbi:MAG: glycosyltransferase family 2 protein, partial [Chloroflexota bacterium]